MGVRVDLIEKVEGILMLIEVIPTAVVLQAELSNQSLYLRKKGRSNPVFFYGLKILFIKVSA